VILKILSLQILNVDGRPVFEVKFKDKMTKYTPKDIITMIYKDLLGKISTFREILIQQEFSYSKAGFCPGFSECQVFAAGMKIVVDKNLENTVWQCF
jgi:hypothetical protein